MYHEDIEDWIDTFEDILINQPMSISYRNMHRRLEIVVELNLNATKVDLRFRMRFKLAIEQIISERGASLRGLVWVS